MSKPSGIQEEPEQKVWRVLRKVWEDSLEDRLNDYAKLGYQAYRIDRVSWSDGRVSYDVVFFNPVLLGEINAKGMAGMLAKVAANPSSILGPEK